MRSIPPGATATPYLVQPVISDVWTAKLPPTFFRYQLDSPFGASNWQLAELLHLWLSSCMRLTRSSGGYKIGPASNPVSHDGPAWAVRDVSPTLGWKQSSAC